MIRFWTHRDWKRTLVLLSEENKKSEPFSYREKVRIFIVWCDREDSNLWPSGSENYDTAHNTMIYSDFLLVLHCYGTPITSNIKQCANDKN